MDTKIKMQTNVTLGYLAAILAGFGAGQLGTDYNRALLSLGVAAVLVVTVAVLNKKGVPVSARAPKFKKSK